MNPKKILLLSLILFMSISVHGCTISENSSSSDVISSMSETSDTQFQTEIFSTATTEPTMQVGESVVMDYVVNTNTGKFHYLYCSSVNQMAEHNKQDFNGNRDDLIAQGYVPCKRCNP